MSFGDILCGRIVSPLIELDEKKRIIQEFVPGKQVTLCHVIANPNESLYTKLGLIDARGAVGIMTITPSEAAMIAADVSTKAAAVEIGEPAQCACTVASNTAAMSQIFFPSVRPPQLQISG